MSELTIPSGISFEPSEDERMMIDSVRRYCQTEIAAFVKAPVRCQKAAISPSPS